MSKWLRASSHDFLSCRYWLFSVNTVEMCEFSLCAGWNHVQILLFLVTVILLLLFDACGRFEWNFQMWMDKKSFFSGKIDSQIYMQIEWRIAHGLKSNLNRFWKTLKIFHSYTTCNHTQFDFHSLLNQKYTIQLLCVWIKLYWNLHQQSINLHNFK